MTSDAFMDRIAGLFGAGESTAKPVHAEESGLPPGQAGTSGVRPQAPAPEVRQAEQTKDQVEDAPKKRGFWGRLFGKGGKKEDSKKKKEGGG
jgi:hypothetical protein